MATLQFPARLPAEVKDWLQQQSDLNGSSMNSEIIRAIREAALGESRLPHVLLAANIIALRRGQPGRLALVIHPRPNRLPAFPVVIGVVVKALLAEDEEHAPLGLRRVSPHFSAANSKPSGLLPDYFISDGDALGTSKPAAIPQPPKFRRISPNVSAGVVIKKRPKRRPPFHLKGVEVVAV